MSERPRFQTGSDMVSSSTTEWPRLAKRARRKTGWRERATWPEKAMHFAASAGVKCCEKGMPVTTNFDTYRKLRMAEAPEAIDIHIMDSGDDAPRGTGETSLPPFIPALTSAIYRASGKRIRRLPITEAL